ncbi:MAG: right-handed parallel beta-helix repeat-containing protein, partial [Bradymonadaceae bacterium]
MATHIMSNLLTGDVTWPAGTYRISEELFIPEGATLRLAPGVVISFINRCGISARGRLIVEGTQEDPVLFEGNWSGILLYEFAVYGSRFDWAVFRGGSGRWCSPGKTGMDARGFPDFALGHFDHGGAITLLDTNDFEVEFHHCVFEDNRTNGGGGALFAYKSTANFTACVFRRNGVVERSSRAPTGHIRGGALLFEESHFDMQECVLQTNQLTVPEPDSSSGGGAIALICSTGHVADTVFYRNMTNSRGGAIHLCNRSELELKGCEFQENTATIGGAIASERWGHCAPLKISKCTFRANWASEQGGAISSHQSLTVEDTHFDENISASGGAMNCNGSTSVRRCVFTGNRAEQTGGAIMVSARFSTIYECRF